MATGEVEINLDGKVETLRSSLSAAKRVNSHGGFLHVINRLQAGDLEFHIMIVAAGLAKKGAEVGGAVFKTGLPSLSRDMVKYVNYLANGGKPYVTPGTETAGSAQGEG